MLASLFAHVASLNDAEYSCPYEIASHLWVGHVPFWLPSTGGKFDSEEFMVGLWFLRLYCALLVATVLPCAVVLCLCAQLKVGTTAPGPRPTGHRPRATTPHPPPPPGRRFGPRVGNTSVLTQCFLSVTLAGASWRVHAARLLAAARGACVGSGGMSSCR